MGWDEKGMGLCLSLVLYNCLRKRMLSSPYCCLNGIILPAGLVERVRGRGSNPILSAVLHSETDSQLFMHPPWIAGDRISSGIGEPISMKLAHHIEKCDEENPLDRPKIVVTWPSQACVLVEHPSTDLITPFYLL